MAGANEPQYTPARLLEEGPDQEAEGRATAWSGQKLIIVLGLGVIGSVCLASAVIAEKGMSPFSAESSEKGTDEPMQDAPSRTFYEYPALHLAQSAGSWGPDAVCTEDSQCMEQLGCAKWGTVDGEDDPEYHCCPCNKCYERPPSFSRYWCTNLDAGYPCKHDFQCKSKDCAQVGSCDKTCQPEKLSSDDRGNPAGYVDLGRGVCLNATSGLAKVLFVDVPFSTPKACAKACDARTTCYGVTALYAPHKTCLLWMEGGLQGAVKPDASPRRCYVKESNQRCPLQCFAPTCSNGPKRYGGTVLSRRVNGQRVCTHRCAPDQAGSVPARYSCGTGTSYFEGVEGGYDCSGCREQSPSSYAAVYNFKHMLASGYLHRQFLRANSSVQRKRCSFHHASVFIRADPCVCDALEGGARHSDLETCMSTCLPNAPQRCQNGHKVICLPMTACEEESKGRRLLPRAKTIKFEPRVEFSEDSLDEFQEQMDLDEALNEYLDALDEELGEEIQPLFAPNAQEIQALYADQEIESLDADLAEDILEMLRSVAGGPASNSEAEASALLDMIEHDDVSETFMQRVSSFSRVSSEAADGSASLQQINLILEPEEGDGTVIFSRSSIRDNIFEDSEEIESYASESLSDISHLSVDSEADLVEILNPEHWGVRQADEQVMEQLITDDPKADLSEASAEGADLAVEAATGIGELGFSLTSVVNLVMLGYAIYSIVETLEALFETPDPNSNCATTAMMLGEPDHTRRMSKYNACLGANSWKEWILCKKATCSSGCPPPRSPPDAPCGDLVPCCPARVTFPLYSQVLSQGENPTALETTWGATCENGMKTLVGFVTSQGQQCIPYQQVLNTKPVSLAWNIFAETHIAGNRGVCNIGEHIFVAPPITGDVAGSVFGTRQTAEKKCDLPGNPGCTKSRHGAMVCPKPPCLVKPDLYKKMPRYIKPMPYKCPTLAMVLRTPRHLRVAVWAPEDILHHQPTSERNGGCKVEDCDPVLNVYDMPWGCHVKRYATYIPTSVAPCRRFLSASGSASISPGYGLPAGAKLVSKKLRLVMERDGSLVLKKADGTKLWAPHWKFAAGSYLAMFSNTWVAVYRGDCTRDDPEGQPMFSWPLHPPDDPQPDDFIKLRLNDDLASLELLAGRHDGNGKVSYIVQWSSNGDTDAS